MAVTPIPSFSTATPAAPAYAPDPQVAKAAQDFEAVFLSTVLNEMLEDAMPKTMGGGAGEQMFISVLGSEMAKKIAASGGLGLARSVEAQLEVYRR